MEQDIKTLTDGALIVTPKDAWLAGYDCEKNGANTQNCHFSFFSKPELTKEWEKGKKSAKREKEGE